LDLGELAVHLGEYLVKASRLLVVQSIGVAANNTALFAEDDLGHLEGRETHEGLLVDRLVAALCRNEELKMIRRGLRAHKVNRRAIEGLVVVPGVLSGVVETKVRRSPWPSG
jgi:hypothetical protein